MERLEERMLLAAQIIDTYADNRGEVVMTVNADLDANTVTSKSVVMRVAGADGKLGTGDDPKVAANVRYRAGKHQITVKSNLPANTGYTITVKGNKVQGADGSLLDGEFNGVDQPSGDGTPGGSYQFKAKGLGASPVARFDTNQGLIDVQLFPSQTPITVNNFYSYANSGRWDNTFIHRSVPGFVIQGGGFKAESGLPEIQTDPAIQNEPGISNTRGTIAMAKLGSNPNSATSEWFFNLADNSQNLNNQNGGFTVFGQITDNAGLAVMDKIAGLQVVDLSGGSSSSPFSAVPVTNAQAAQNGPSSANDLALIKRVAIKMKVKPLTPPATA